MLLEPTSAYDVRRVWTAMSVLMRTKSSLQGKSMRELLGPFPVVREWMQRVVDTTAPHHANASKLLMRAAARFAERKAQAQAKL